MHAEVRENTRTHASKGLSGLCSSCCHSDSKKENYLESQQQLRIFMANLFELCQCLSYFSPFVTSFLTVLHPPVVPHHSLHCSLLTAAWKVTQPGDILTSSIANVLDRGERFPWLSVLLLVPEMCLKYIAFFISGLI